MYFIFFLLLFFFFVFFCNDTATTDIYTLSLHDALPNWPTRASHVRSGQALRQTRSRSALSVSRDRKSTRLNSSHVRISYAVFCLKKKKKKSRDFLAKKKEKEKK